MPIEEFLAVVGTDFFPNTEQKCAPVDFNNHKCSKHQQSRQLCRPVSEFDLGSQLDSSPAFQGLALGGCRGSWLVYLPKLKKSRWLIPDWWSVKHSSFWTKMQGQPVDHGARLFGRTRLRNWAFADRNSCPICVLKCTICPFNIFRAHFACDNANHCKMCWCFHKKMFLHTEAFTDRHFYKQKNDILCQFSTDLDVMRKVFARQWKIDRLRQHFNIVILHKGGDRDFKIVSRGMPR